MTGYVCTQAVHLLTEMILATTTLLLTNSSLLQQRKQLQMMQVHNNHAGNHNMSKTHLLSFVFIS